MCTSSSRRGCEGHPGDHRDAIKGHQLHTRAGCVAGHVGAGRLSRRSRRLSGIAARLARPNRCPSYGRQDTRSVLATTAASAVTAAQSTVTTAVVPRGRWSRRRRCGVLAAGRRRRHMVPAKASLFHRLRGPVAGPRCRGECGRSGFGSMYHRVQARAVGSGAECRCVRGGALWLARL